MKLEAPGDTHQPTNQPEAIPPSLTPLVFERFLPSLTLWLSPNCCHRRDPRLVRVLKRKNVYPTTVYFGRPMSTAQQNHEAAEEDLKLWLAFFTLVDIFLIFAGLIVMNTTAWWIRVPYHIAAILLAIFVMRLAYIAAVSYTHLTLPTKA